jgi:succinate dehydrogenase / fumarate reductase cytochrome b subunit
MNKKIRPLSPHLLVYKSEFTSLLSIFHRICGSFLLFTLFSILIFFNCFYFLFTFSKAFFLFDFFVPIFNIIFIFLKIFLVFIFFFHLTNGIRHLLWDKKCLFNWINYFFNQFYRVFYYSLIFINVFFK